MGICLSCLKPTFEDDQSQFGENSPLLNNQQNNYDKDAALREREDELNKIVDETNEQLIDVTTFFTTNSSITELAVEKPLTGKLQDDSQLTNLQKKVESVGKEQLTTEERQIYEETQLQLYESLKKQITIKKQGDLIIEFS